MIIVFTLMTFTSTMYDIIDHAQIKEFVERTKSYMHSDQFHVVGPYLFWIWES